MDDIPLDKILDSPLSPPFSLPAGDDHGAVAGYGLLLTLLVRPSPDPVALWPDPVTPAMDPVALARLPLLAGATTVAIERRRRWWISGIRGEREVVALVDRACGCGSGADGRGGLQVRVRLPRSWD